MKRLILLILVLGIPASDLYSTGLVQVGIFGSGNVLTVKAKPDGNWTGAAITSLIFSVRWPTSYGISVSEIALAAPAQNGGATAFTGLAKDGGTLTNGIYTYQSYNGVLATTVTWTAGSEYEIGSITITGGVGTGTFDLCPNGFTVAGDWYIELAGGAPYNAATPLYQASVAGVTLPVELVSLTANARGRNIDISWATKTETNNYGFDVERKAISNQQSTINSWEKVGFVEGKGTTNAPQNYGYKDVVKSAGTFTYRLKQTDRDGKFTYSAQVEAKAVLTADDYKMSQNYPNPFNPSTKFNFAVSTPQHVSVKVFNNIGQEVQTLFNGIAPADQIQEVTFDGARLASGIYFYVLRAQDRVEVKKMLMMK
jgi:hypothetical protein